ncbi:hypothetical protein ACOMHN_060342 [Nucella lapillus]
MATGRSGQLVLTDGGSKDSPHVKHVPQVPGVGADTAYFVQRRFEDTALVIFQQHAKRLKEVSPGVYHPLAARTSTNDPSLHVIPGLEPDLEVGVSAYLDRSAAASDVASTGSGGSLRRSSAASPQSSSLGARTSLRKDSESSAEKTSENCVGDSGIGVEENGAPSSSSSDQVFAEGVLKSAARPTAAASFSDSSSVGSSAPDSDLDEGGGPLAAAAGDSSLQTALDVVEDHHLHHHHNGEKSVGKAGDDSPARGEPRRGLRQQGEGVTFAQSESQRISSVPNSPVNPLPPKDASVIVSEPRREPYSPEELPQVREPSSFNEPQPSRGELREATESFLPSGSVDVGEISAAGSEEDIQITRL